MNNEGRTSRSSELPSRRLPTRWLHAAWFLPIALLGLSLAQFAPFLFGSGHGVVSDSNNDLATQFYLMRSFGFSQLREGRLALWNPYIYSGIPFMGGWQSGLLYPPNWIYLILPLERALNWEVAISVFLTGLGTALWTRHHGFHPAAALLSGTMAMFGGPFFLHVNAGHLSTLDAMAWTPFVLLAVDGVIASVRPMDAMDALPISSAPLSPEGRGAGGEGSALKWALVAALAFAMQVLAGHPQTLFNTVVTVVIYCALRLAIAPRRWPAAPILAASGLAAVAMASVQIVAGLAAAADGIRRGGLDYRNAAWFSFPPFNFITALVPTFFGNVETIHYWGRGYYWEMCVYVGIAGFGLSIYGLLRADSPLRRTWAVMVFLLFWIALAGNTPLFTLLYHVPGFNRFRGHSKFIYEAALFACLAAGGGLDAILRRKGQTLGLAAAAAVVGALLIAFGFSLNASVFGVADGSPWQHFQSYLWRTQETWMFPDMSSDAFQAASQGFAGTSCLVFGSVALAFAAAAALAHWKPRPAAAAMVALGIIELFTYAHMSFATFQPGEVETPSPSMQSVIAANPGDYRVLLVDFVQINQAMALKTSTIWGYDPSVLGRYDELMTYGQTGRADYLSDHLTLVRLSPFFNLFRLRYFFLLKDGTVYAQPAQNPLPHAFLVNQVVTLTGRDRILAAMSDPTFDIGKTVVLEIPSPIGGAGDGGTVAPSGAIDVSDDYPGCLTIHADVTGRAIAVITDPYSRGWHATALAGSSQSHYDVLPADYAAMAIPLSPGKHNIRLTYVPDGFTAAAWVSGISTALFLVLALWTSVSRQVKTRPRKARLLKDDS